jgi:prohibitin 2
LVVYSLYRVKLGEKMTEKHERTGHKYFLFKTKTYTDRFGGNNEERTETVGISIKRLFILITTVILVLIAISTLLGMAKTVDAGYNGVLTNWGEAVAVLEPGFHWIGPIGQDVVPVNIQIQKVEATESTASSDLQEVTTTVAVNYQLHQSQVLSVYKTLRNDYEIRVIIPNIQEALKASTAKYVATALITNREAVKDTFLNVLKSKLNAYGIEVLQVSVTNFAFSPSFTTAIEAKVTAEQNALAAQNKLKQIEFEAQQQVIQANANATALVTIANASANVTVITANATAQAVRIIESQLTPNYIAYLYAIGWDGKLPLYWTNSNSSSTPFLMIPATK